MVTCQSVNQLKTPAKVSWAFKMISQFGSLGYTIMGKTADLTADLTRGSRGLMDRALGLKPKVRIPALAGSVHDWGETLEQGTKPPTAPWAPHSRLPTAPFGWVKCREHISLLIILCIIVYVTNKAHLSLIFIVLLSRRQSRKRCTTNRENRSLMRIVKWNRFKNLGEIQGMDWGWGQGIKSHHTQTCRGIWLQLSSEASYLG